MPILPYAECLAVHLLSMQSLLQLDITLPDSGSSTNQA